MNSPPLRPEQLSPKLSPVAFGLDDPRNGGHGNNGNNLQHFLASPTKMNLDGTGNGGNGNSLIYRTSLSKLSELSRTGRSRQRSNSDTLRSASPIRLQFFNNAPKMLKPEYVAPQQPAGMPLLSALIGPGASTSRLGIRETLEMFHRGLSRENYASQEPSQAKPQAQAQAQAQAQVQAQAQAQPQAQPQPQPQPQSRSQVQSQSQTQSQSQSQAQSQSQTQSQSQSQAQSQMQSQTQSQTQAQAQTRVQAQSPSPSHSQLQLQPQSQPQSHSLAPRSQQRGAHIQEQTPQIERIASESIINGDRKNDNGTKSSHSDKYSHDHSHVLNHSRDQNRNFSNHSYNRNHHIYHTHGGAGIMIDVDATLKGKQINSPRDTQGSRMASNSSVASSTMTVNFNDMSKEMELDLLETDKNGFVELVDGKSNRCSFISSNSTDFDADWYNQQQSHISEETAKLDYRIKQLELEIDELKLQNEKLIRSITTSRTVEDKFMLDALKEIRFSKQRAQRGMERKVKQLERKIENYRKVLRTIGNSPITPVCTPTLAASSHTQAVLESPRRQNCRKRIERISSVELRKIEEQNDSSSSSSEGEPETMLEDEKAEQQFDGVQANEHLGMRRIGGLQLNIQLETEQKDNDI